MIANRVLGILAVSPFFSSAVCHMIMKSPTPYNLDIPPFVQVDPLGPLFPFPCQNKFGVQSRTVLEAGGVTLVEFTGGAQHGGGSCQFSISYDDPGTVGWNKSASFKTVYSIIGGCPAHFTDESQNLPSAPSDEQGRQNSAHCGNDSGINCIRQFLVPIPAFLKNGPATFSWTWFNKIGNKEMYMTCAPVNITGGTEDDDKISSLPDIFVANIPGVPNVPTCSTGNSVEHLILNFPEPGAFGRIIENPVEAKAKPANYCSMIPGNSNLPTF
ncbi:hypothetical protein B0H67DRAFT_474612, partial [Lasiosphaeris hirsuta]